MRFGLLVFALFCLTLVREAAGNDLSSHVGTLRVEPVLTGLSEPWGIAFLPDGGVLVTERGGRLILLRDGSAHQVTGTPEVVAKGQGGLLDVLVPRDFAASREIVLTHSARVAGGSHTAVSVGRLSADGTRLAGLRRIFQAEPGASGGRHFGSRVVEAGDGTLFVTIGERGDRREAQSLASHHGTVVRIARDGSAAEGNPFLGVDGARREIWSYGHRNAQGAAFDPQGRLMIVEHGARGGDEINLVRKGANYGWPVISYGVHYSGARIGEGTAKPGMEQPEFHWDPSIAPSGMMIYSGRLWPDWRGDIFVGSLKFDYISRLGGSPLREREQIKGPETDRVRDIAEAPDGTIWFLSVGNGALYRLAPG